jgi:lipoprotein-anchoring transpeptidase ErfK/SrfK
VRRSPWIHSTRAAIWGAIPAAAVFAVIDRAPAPAPMPRVQAELPVARVIEPADAGPAPIVAAAEPVDAGPSFERPTQVIALAGWTPVRAEARRDAHALGYLRAGAVVDVLDGPAGRDGCVVHRDHPEGGWYHVRGGGFVCVGGGFAVPAPARGYRAPTQPDLAAPMPYPYAINYGRSVMYRRLPTLANLHEFEPWRFSRLVPDAGSPALSDADTHAAPQGVSGDGDDDRPAPRVAEVRDAGGPPTLGDLAGERGGPVVRRLLSGMYVALDRTVRNSATDEIYWRTQSGGFVRSGRLSQVRNWSRFQGQVLDEAHHLPMAWMVSETGWEYTPLASGAGATMHRRAPRHTSFALSDDPPIRSGTQTYWRTVDGRAVNQRNVRRALLREPPQGVGPTEKWIDVDLDEQVLVAYEGARPVFATLVSSGRGDRHSGVRNYESPTGSFRIESRHITTTMDGDTAGDGPYSIEDVPWVMYFHGSYAIHGAFWHTYFGWRMSHGCINLSPPDARWVFLWADPALPAGWHGVYAGDTQPGARVELRHSRANAPEEDRPSSAAHAMPAVNDR